MIAVTPDPTFSNVTESVRRTSSRGQLWVEGGTWCFGDASCTVIGLHEFSLRG
jgi:hypothetical protein